MNFFPERLRHVRSRLMRRGLRLAVVLVATVHAPSLLLSDENAQEFARLSERARQLASNQKATSAERVAMVAELSSYTTAAAAMQIMAVGLAATDHESQLAAREALSRLVEDRRIKASLIATFRRESTRGSPIASELALVLLAAESAENRGDFRGSLDRMPPSAVLATCESVCSKAVRLGDKTALAALSALTQTRCFTTSLACRRSVVDAFTRIPSVEAIEALLKLLETAKGQTRGDILAPLVRVSGKSPNADPGSLREWLDKHRAQLGKLPLASDKHPILSDDGDNKNEQTMPAYYDMPIYADRVVFVIDNSTSMEGPPLEAAKRELASAIFGLPETCVFTVIFFHGNVGFWQRQLVPASDPNKRAAADFVSRLSTGEGTATYDALHAALTFDSEAIYFLSDGEPTAGRIVEPEDILRNVSQLNAGRGISVNTVSIMGGAEFLEELAHANHGHFRSVDE